MSRPATPASTQGSRSGSTTPAAAAAAATTVATALKEEALLEITKATLTLRDDGVVFTDPPNIRGVPLAKIDARHPYWRRRVGRGRIVVQLIERVGTEQDELPRAGGKRGIGLGVVGSAG